MRKSHNYSNIDKILEGYAMPQNLTPFGDDEFDRSFNKTMKRGAGVFIGLWALSVLASLGVTVVVIWAIVQLVQWVTAK